MILLFTTAHSNVNKMLVHDLNGIDYSLIMRTNRLSALPRSQLGRIIDVQMYKLFIMSTSENY